MKIGFSSRVCPEWYLPTVLTTASKLQFSGVELSPDGNGTLRPGEDEGTLIDSTPLEHLFADCGVELFCLASNDTLDSPKDHEATQSRERILLLVEWAARLGCPLVRVPIGHTQRGESRHAALSRMVPRFRVLAVQAARFGVTVLVENGGDFVGSHDLWSILDDVSHPNLAACWNPCAAMTDLERPTVSIPRLGTRIKLVHICDAVFDERGRFGGYRPLGDGNVELRRVIELLRGILYRGPIIFDCPKAAATDFPSADDVLAAVQARLREWVDSRSEMLSAYKGDKQAVCLDLPADRSLEPT